MTVVYASDGRDIKRLTWSVRSVRKYLSGDARIFVLATNAAPFSGLGVTCIDPTSILAECGLSKPAKNRKWPFSASYRLAIPLLDAFSAEDRVLYLDTDTIIRRPEARYMFEVPDLGRELIGASDVSRAQGWTDSTLAREGITDEMRNTLLQKVWCTDDPRFRRYVNSGVLAFCVGNIRRNGIDWWRTRVRWYASLFGLFRHPDQDFLNVFCSVRADLSWKFNAIRSGVDSASYIQHFAGRKHIMPDVAKRLGIDYDASAGSEVSVSTPPAVDEPTPTAEHVPDLFSRLLRVKRFTCLANKVSMTWDSLKDSAGFSDPGSTCLVVFNKADLWSSIPPSVRAAFPVVLHIRRFHKRKHIYIGRDCVVGENVIRMKLDADGSLLPGLFIRLCRAQDEIVRFTALCTEKTNGVRHEPTTGGAVAAALIKCIGLPVSLVGFVDDERVKTRNRHHDVPVEHEVLRELGALFDNPEGSYV